MSFNTTTNNIKLGLGNGGSGGGRIVKVIGGSFRITVPEGADGSVIRENKEGKVVSELIFSSLSGYITDIKKEDSKYGLQVKISIKADKDYTLSLGYSDGITSNLFKMLPNVNIAEPVEMSLVTKEEDGKKRTSIFMKQNGENVKWAFTKSNPGEMPPFEQIVVKGAKQWDNTKQIDWLWDNAVPKFEKKDEFEDFNQEF